jgi:glycosyltransferase involved in cell wall biosynthesis
VRVGLDVSAVPARLAGAGRYVAELARRLPSAGVDVSLVTRRGDGARWRAWSHGSAVSSVVPDARARRLWYEAFSLGVGEVARGVDVWHGPHYTMPRRGATPTVVTIHDMTFFTDPQWHERSKVAYFRRAIEYSARHARVLLSVSDFTARQLDELLPGHAPVVVAPHGVDLTRFTPEANDDDEAFGRAGLPWPVPYVLFLGTLEPRKGVDTLASAFADLARADASIELWLAGQDGWGLGPLEAALAGHAARDRVRRLGYVDDALVPALLRRSSAVAYPSRGEGFGLPVLEALACGALVVTSEATVMAEVAGEAATLVGAGDADALAAALAACVAASDGERAARARAGRARAERFTWEASIARHLEAYAQAGGGG